MHRLRAHRLICLPERHITNSLERPTKKAIGLQLSLAAPTNCGSLRVRTLFALSTDLKSDLWTDQKIVQAPSILTFLSCLKHGDPFGPENWVDEAAWTFKETILSMVLYRRTLNKADKEGDGQFIKSPTRCDWRRLHSSVRSPYITISELSATDQCFSEGKWRNRQRHWNKREWRIQRRDRGPHLPIPAEIVHLPLWRKDGSDVGDWRKKAAAPVDEPPTSTALQDDSIDVYRHHELLHCDDHGGAFSLATPEENPGGWNSYNVSEQIQ